MKNMNKPLKILVSGYTGLGNMVLKIPFLETLHQLYPHAQIDIIASNNFGSEIILQKKQYINKIFVLPHNTPFFQKLHFFYTLRHQAYTLIFIGFDNQANFLMWGSYVARIPLRIRHFICQANVQYSYKSFLRRYLLYPKTVFVPTLPHRHEIDLNYDLLNAYHPPYFERKYNTYIENFNIETVFNRFNIHKKQYIVIQPGAANGLYKIKTWHTANFAHLIKTLKKIYPTLQIVLVGDTADHKNFVQPLLTELQSTNNNQNIINTAGSTSLPELITLLANAQLVICHDSGIMHLADALHTPLIALYNPTDFTRTRPLKNTSHLIFAKPQNPNFTNIMYNFSVSEAQLHAKGIQHEAMQGIDFEEIITTIKKLLP